MKNNKISTLIDYLQQGLSDRYDDQETRAIIARLFDHYLGYSQMDLVAKRQETLTESNLLKFHFALKRLKKGEPVQYVLGETEFYGLNLQVSPGVLIPRPETEELVRWVLEEISVSSPAIIDWCTGSGCIALALKSKLPNAMVYGLDESDDALKIALENAERTGLDVTWEKADLLQENTWEPDLKVDVVVSNPPYVAQSESKDLAQHVLEHEPEMALFVPDDDPLIFYRHLAEWGIRHLKENGALYLEIHQNQHQEMISLLRSMGFSDIEARKDLNGNWRMVSARLL